MTTPDLKIGYDLAEDVQASEDGLTWQVKIRDDVRFTDGEPLTAEDVADTKKKQMKDAVVDLMETEFSDADDMDYDKGW